MSPNQNLLSAEQVAEFQNPFRQGEQLPGKPILAPEHLPEGVHTVYVGPAGRTSTSSCRRGGSWP